MSLPKIRGLGIWTSEGKVFMAYVSSKNNSDEFTLDYSHDGEKFSKLIGNAFIKNNQGKIIISDVSDFRMIKTGEIYNLFYIKSELGKPYLYMAASGDCRAWEEKGRLFPITEAAVQIPYFTHKNKQVIFFGGKDLNVALESKAHSWNVKRIGTESGCYTVAFVKEHSKGILLMYFKSEEHEDHLHHSLWSLVLDKNEPTKIIPGTQKLLWLAPQEWIYKDVSPMGVVEIESVPFSYWQYPNYGVFVVSHDRTQKYVFDKSPLPHAMLVRHLKNPILSPYEKRLWENKQVFNTAAVYHNGQVHLLYRAVGDGDVSVLGYATSSDGTTINRRFARPAYIPREEFELSEKPKSQKYFSPYESGGGGYGGIEDPRITKIEDKFYLTYVAYNGKTPPRLAMSYINVADFDKRDWQKWSKPVLISPPGEVNKNGCLLPEKVNGKYVIFHRVYPDILIDMVDNLDFDGKSVWLKGHYRIHPRPNFWDSNKVGIGPPPIKTKDGWLAIYQGVGFQDNGRYKIGAMLLDLKDPSKVLYRATNPILEPETYYENGGFKAGVVYPCGAVVLGDTLIVYYGGSDTYIAAATTNLNEFLDALKFDKMPHVDPVSVGNLPKYVETG